MNEWLHDRRASTDRRPEAASPQDLYARRIVARIAEHAEATTPPDVVERLRFARTQALERARAVRRASEASAAAPMRKPAVERGLALAGGGGTPEREPSPWRVRLAAALPVVALLGGLWMIQQQHAEQQMAAAVEIDAELLTDAVPPAAYGDPGFVEYLKAPQP